jgi:hypothetical protein
MQLQEYDLKVVHISGANNFFADTLSRNPVGLNKESRHLVSKPKEIFVAKIDLGINKALLKELDSLAKHQLSDPVLAKIWEDLEKGCSTYKGRYMIRNHILHCKDNRTHLYWRAMLPKQSTG